MRYIATMGEREKQLKFFLLDYRDGRTLEGPGFPVVYTYWLLLRPYDEQQQVGLRQREYYYAMLACRPGVKSSCG